MAKTNKPKPPAKAKAAPDQQPLLDSRKARIDKAATDLQALQLPDGGTPEQREAFTNQLNQVIADLKAPE